MAKHNSDNMSRIIKVTRLTLAEKISFGILALTIVNIALTVYKMV